MANVQKEVLADLLGTGTPTSLSATAAAGSAATASKSDHDHGPVGFLKTATGHVSIGGAAAPSAVGQVLTVTGTGAAATATWQSPSGAAAVAVMQDQKSATTAGQSLTLNTYVTHDLQTIQSDPNNIISSLTSNQFTLGAGKYLIEWKASVVQTGNNSYHDKTRLYNVTDATAVSYSHTGCQYSGNGMISGAAVVNIASSKTFRVEQWTNGSPRTGDAINDGNMNVYLTVTVTKFG